MGRELTGLEQDITAAIAARYPYPLNEVQHVYKHIRSFDKTIEFLEICMRDKLSPMQVMEVFKAL
ncbi:hypothetical protein [Pontibacter beigongshangensis]|uniref:hypothetical protein n=1 Tax=Pontibacter beigongshangensis TaxID=2574733 RepID=UPI0016508168|nr:hypothetical protein [Pontibacter beigongshangensis]